LFSTKTVEFDYKQAFQRNYGIFTNDEQEKIRNAKILLVGCGGVGGVMAILLARCGVENFVLVD
jgi:tRNA A37 threonylcarbamoyladenosine dehydratase